MTAVWEEPWGPTPPMFTGRVNTYTRTGKQNHHYLLDGEPLDGVTTVLDLGIAKQKFLTPWAAKTVALEARRSLGYWKMLPENEAVDFLKGAQYRTKTDAGAKGTEVHRWAEHRAATGALPDLGDVDVIVRNQVEALGRFFDDWQVEIVHSEIVVFNRAELYAGTLDIICWVTLPTGERVLALLDFKTSKHVYPETALQLAAYRYADFFLADDGSRVGMPGVQMCGVVWLPANPPTQKMAKAGGYQLIPMQADRVCYRTFLQAKALARFNEKGSAVVGKPLTPPDLGALAAEKVEAVAPEAPAADPFDIPEIGNR